MVYDSLKGFSRPKRFTSNYKALVTTCKPFIISNVAIITCTVFLVVGGNDIKSIPLVLCWQHKAYPKYVFIFLHRIKKHMNIFSFIMNFGWFRVFWNRLNTVKHIWAVLFLPYCMKGGGFPPWHWFPLRTAHYLTGGLLFRLCGLIHVCEQAQLVSQTLNSALALITANLNDAATDSYHRRAQKYRLGWTVAKRGRKPEGNSVGTSGDSNVSYAV